MAEKEVTPTNNIPKPEVATTPTQNIPKPGNTPTPTNKPLGPRPQPIKYKYAGKESLSESIAKILPKQLIPTKRMGSIFGSIFLVVIIIAAFQLPYSEIMSGNIDIVIKIGYPLNFLELGLKEAESSSVNYPSLLLDILIYILLAYIIDVIISSILKNPLLKSEEEKKKVPTIFKNKKQTFAEKATEKVIAKEKKI